MVNTIIEIIAKNPPSIAVAIGGLLALTGDYTNQLNFYVQEYFCKLYGS